MRPASPRSPTLLALCLACGIESGPAPDPRPATPPERPAPIFHLAATGHGDLELVPLVGGLLVTTPDEFHHIDAEGRLATIDTPLPDDIDIWLTPPGGGQRMRFRHEFELAGRWPDGVWLIPQGSLVERLRPPSAVFRLAGRVWVTHPTIKGEHSMHYAAVVGWSDGQVLGLRVAGPREYSRHFIANYPAMVWTKVPPDTRFELLGAHPEPAWPLVDPTLIAITAAAAPDGALYMIGHRGYLDKLFVQRWGTSRAEADRVGVVDELPGDPVPRQLVVGAHDLAYLGGATFAGHRPYLARFDGATWTQEPGPGDTRLRDLSLAPGDDLWAIHGPEDAPVLARRRAPGVWDTVPLPTLDAATETRWTYDQNGRPTRQTSADGRVHPIQVVARGDADVWVVGELGDTTVLLRSAPLPAPPAELGEDRQALADRHARPFEAWQPGRSCAANGDPLAVLTTLPEGTADDAAVPAAQAFVRDGAAVLPHVRGIYEFVDDERRFVGLFFDASITARDVQHLRAALASAAPGESHELVCRSPVIRRMFDLATGPSEPAQARRAVESAQ